jgi:hypothetical protein
MSELSHSNDDPEGEMSPANSKLTAFVQMPAHKELTQSQIIWRLMPLAAGAVIALTAIAMEPKLVPWGVVSFLVAAALGAISFFTVVPYLPGNQSS